jgi:replication-associated recombination protein RarA
MTQAEQRSAALSFRIKPSLKAALEELAKADMRPLSNYLEVVLKAHAEAESKKQQEAKRRRRNRSARFDALTVRE